MKRLIKKILIDNRGNIVIQRTKVEQVRGLIKKLHPQKTGKELMRLGPNGDGGYLVPDDLQGIKACFSPGVDTESNFEKDCRDLGIAIYMADRSVDAPNLDLKAGEFSFIKKYIGTTDNDEFITMDTWVNSFVADESELLLQMDIEGGEYASFINISNALLKRFRILVIEFHTLNELWDPVFFNMAEMVFNKILQTHTCVHIHPNNFYGIEDKFGVAIPPIAEFTFLRNDRIIHAEPAVNFPHPLDADCTNKTHVILPKDWYNNS